MRYTVKDKLKMVKEHVCEGIPLHEIAKKYEYDVATIKFKKENSGMRVRLNRLYKTKEELIEFIKTLKFKELSLNN